MRSLLWSAALAVLVGLAATPASAAAANAEFGNLCEGTLVTAQEVTAVQTQRSTGGLPPSAPANGVITAWRVNGTLSTEKFPQRLVVLRPSGSQLTIVAESAPETVGGGINVFETRLPVHEGDKIGIEGKPLLCETSESGDVVGISTESVKLGSSPAFPIPDAERLLSVMAVVEPDLDGDGYGDETQDFCPASAARQEFCATIVHQAAAIVERGRVTVLVTASGPATATVSGKVKLGGGRSAKLAPVTKAVKPPRIARLVLKLPAKVKKALAGLRRGQTLPMAVLAKVTDEIGRTDTATGRLRLP
jgi:hypothetical protein